MTIKEALKKLRTKYPEGLNSIDLEVDDHDRPDQSLDIEFRVWIGCIKQSFYAATLEAAVSLACEESGTLAEAEDVSKEAANA